jgi:hypothetical protein
MTVVDSSSYVFMDTFAGHNGKVNKIPPQGDKQKQVLHCQFIFLYFCILDNLPTMIFFFFKNEGSIFLSDTDTLPTRLNIVIAKNTTKNCACLLTTGTCQKAHGMCIHSYNSYVLAVQLINYLRKQIKWNIILLLAV